MKEFKKYIVLLLMTIALAGCQQDFNELRDSAQRQIVFTFTTDSLFSRTLLYDGSKYYLPEIDALPSDCRLRITGYCYDGSDRLVSSDRFVTTYPCERQMLLRHLHKDSTYHFAFVADVVKYDPQEVFYETWIQLGTERMSTFYFYSDKRYDDALYNVAGVVMRDLQAANQTETVSFKPLTYNCYIVLKNAENFDRIWGDIMYVNAFDLVNFDFLHFATMAYTFDYRTPKADIVMPLSLCIADDAILPEIRTNSIAGKDTSIISIRNLQHRPFVATFDCATHEQESCIFY